MAVGDAINGISSVTSGNTLTIQPGAGVSWLILGITSDKVVGSSPNVIPDITVQLYDGTIYSTLWNSASGAYDALKQPFYITNSRYLVITNANVATALIGYYGIQIA